MSAEERRPLATEDVLRAAFPGAAGAPGPAISKLHIIPQGAEPRWIMVGDPRKAAPVLRSWRPFNLSTRARWAVVVAAASAGWLPRIPQVRSEEAMLDFAYWRATLPGFHDGWVPVVHVGNASHTRKAIVFWVDPGRGIQAVAKVPLVPGAAAAILNEASVLDQLDGRGSYPTVLCRDAERGIAAQSWLEGAPVSRSFTNEHLVLLAGLARPGQTATVQAQSEAREADLERAGVESGLRQRAVEIMQYDTPLPSVIEHRDFAPWNLKRLKGGRLGLLDWEWAVMDGLPCQDLFRFFYIQDALFKGPGRVWHTIQTHPLLKVYYDQFSIPAAALAPLAVHYLARVIAMDTESGSAELVSYSTKQLQIVLDSL